MARKSQKTDEQHTTVSTRRLTGERKSQVVVGMAVVVGLLVLWFAGYGMLHSDQGILTEVWELVKMTTSFLIGWAGGKAFAE
jgi:hypothetical protein